MSNSTNVVDLFQKINNMIEDGIIEECNVEDNISSLKQKISKFEKQSYRTAEKNVMNFFKAISNSKRIKIIQLLKIGAKCSCELEWSLKLSQPTISHHLRILENSNIIKITQKGKWKLISLNETPIIFWLLEQLDK